jgi:Cu-Zn family superoxide dismutase
MTLALGGLLALAAAGPAQGGTGVVRASGSLRDLQPTVANSTDGASARLVGYPDGGGTSFTLIVTGLNDSVGTTYGAHAHTGPCIAGNGDAAGPHFNTTTSPKIIDAQHEVWLDFTVAAGGYGVGETTVPFVIPSGAARSVVIHALATNPVTGAAGARQACLPVAF